MKDDSRGRLINSALIQLLREGREKRGLSLNEVAQRAGVDRVSLGRVEKGGRFPGLWYLYDVAQGIGLDFKSCIKEAEARLETVGTAKGRARK